MKNGQISLIFERNEGYLWVFFWCMNIEIVMRNMISTSYKTYKNMIQKCHLMLRQIHHQLQKEISLQIFEWYKYENTVWTTFWAIVRIKTMANSFLSFSAFLMNAYIMKTYSQNSQVESRRRRKWSRRNNVMYFWHYWARQTTFSSRHPWGLQTLIDYELLFL